MGQKYIKDYTKKQIHEILEQIQNCIKINSFTLSLNNNRTENQNFIKNYFLTKNKVKDILLGIKVEDFCYSLPNRKVGYEKEILHVFCPKVRLFNFENEEEVVSIYTKFNMINKSVNKHVVVISFHKKNKPIDYLFLD